MDFLDLAESYRAEKSQQPLQVSDQGDFFKSTIILSRKQ